MKTRVRRWGNSLGVRLPKSVTRDSGIEEGCELEIRLENGHVVLRPVRSDRYSLDDLLGGIRKSNLHEEVSTGDPRGNETW